MTALTVSPDLSSAPVREGEVVAGKYRVERLLGEGGMGVVVAARHLALGEPVALKFVLGGRDLDREVMARMMREARATFRLRSEHTVRVLDVGELPSGALYIVMELLDGRDLKAELAARGPLPEDEVVRHALGACDALEEAHALGIVHRDLKPHNMFLARSARGATVLKILDFGLSKLDPERFEAGPLTRPEMALGTPRYMAPEQWQSAAAVDARADVWALGGVMYELLTGEAPVSKLRGAERRARLLAGAIESPRDLRPELSEGVAKAIMRCLRPDPGARWPSVRHLASALRDAHPSLRQPERFEVTRTDVTRAVPAELLRKQAAEAFGPTHEPESVGRPTMPDSPTALNLDAPASADFDVSTEVRAPSMLDAPATVQDLPPPSSQRPPTAPLGAVVPHASTLRSAGRPLELEATLGSRSNAKVVEPTLRMASAPVRDAIAAKAAAAPAPAPVSGPGSGRSPSGVARTEPMEVLARPAKRGPLPPRALVLVTAGGILSLAAIGAIVWAVVRLFAGSR